MTTNRTVAGMFLALVAVGCHGTGSDVPTHLRGSHAWIDGRLGGFWVQESRADVDAWGEDSHLSLKVVSKKGPNGSVMTSMLVNAPKWELQEPGSFFVGRGVACGGEEPNQWDVDATSDEFWLEVVDRTDRSIHVETGFTSDNGRIEAGVELGLW